MEFALCGGSGAKAEADDSSRAALGEDSDTGFTMGSTILTYVKVNYKLHLTSETVNTGSLGAFREMHHVARRRDLVDLRSRLPLTRAAAGFAAVPASEHLC